jgi:hypothetical protein
MKIGRNAPCPCGSGKKHKSCCLGTVAWEDIPPLSEAHFRHLTVRGKNEIFLANLADALQIDQLSGSAEWADVKRACTARAVQRIYSSIMDIWPDEADLERTLAANREHATALYIGSYEEDLILRGLTRHLLYADIILLPDPFSDPRRLRPQYNPLLSPAAYRVTTLKWARLWLQLAPWIDAGVVRFVRTPADFDSELWMACAVTEKEKYSSNKELKAIADKEIAETAERMSQTEFRLLTMSDALLARRFAADEHVNNELDLQQFMRWIERRRRQHPYYIADPDGGGRLLNNQYLQFFSGAGYELAKLTARITGSHLITDMRTRWREVQLDRDHAKLGKDPWQPFSKAFTDLDFEFLNKVPLQTALQIRKEGYLESFRSFFRKVWRSSVSEDEFSADAASALAEELASEMNTAKAEFARIRAELARWLSAGLTAGISQICVSGSAEYVGAGVLATALSTAGVAYRKTRLLLQSSPAAFLLNLKERSE